MTYSLRQKTLKNLEEIVLDALRKPKNPQVRLATCDTTNETFSQMPNKSPRNHLQITHKTRQTEPKTQAETKTQTKTQTKQHLASPKNFSAHRKSIYNQK